MLANENGAIACSHCFSDRGLRLDAERIGIEGFYPCPICGSTDSKKLSVNNLELLTYRFFVWGSLSRAQYGAAPVIQFNRHQKTSIEVAPWLSGDVALIERLLGVGFFLYGPRLWMLGEVEPLKLLQEPGTRRKVIDRILAEYPAESFEAPETFYRVRINPAAPGDISQYDGPPHSGAGRGRLDSKKTPILYGSTDLEVCIHECRVLAEDEIFVATLAPSTSLRLLDLSTLLKEGDVTEFESLDLAVHMLFQAGKHAYEITRAIAAAARDEGFDGVIYPSYFSLLRLGQMPYRTTYGMSHRRIPAYQSIEQGSVVRNLAVFGRPVSEGKVSVLGINRLILSRVMYDFHFGPVSS